MYLTSHTSGDYELSWGFRPVCPGPKNTLILSNCRQGYRQTACKTSSAQRCSQRRVTWQRSSQPLVAAATSVEWSSLLHGGHGQLLAVPGSAQHRRHRRPRLSRPRADMGFLLQGRLSLGRRPGRVQLASGSGGHWIHILIGSGWVDRATTPVCVKRLRLFPEKNAGGLRNSASALEELLGKCARRW